MKTKFQCHCAMPMRKTAMFRFRLEYFHSASVVSTTKFNGAYPVPFVQNFVNRKLFHYFAGHLGDQKPLMLHMHGRVQGERF